MRNSVVTALFLLVGVSLWAGEARVLRPALAIPLPTEAKHPRDVTWLSADVLLATATGGVFEISLEKAEPRLYVPEGPLPDGSPDPELIDADESTVFVMGGGRRNYLQLDWSGSPLFSFAGGPLVPRGLAVVDGHAFILGWMAGKPSSAEEAGALWKVPLGDALSDMVAIHSIESDDEAVGQFRTTGFPYAGAVVAEPTGTIAVMTTVEPGIFRYTAEGRLEEVIAPELELSIDHRHLAANFARDVTGRYTEMLNRQPLLEDLVSTPFGLAVLIRTVEANEVGWTLRFVEGKRNGEEIALEPRANGPFGHMRCESRGSMMACIASFPPKQDAKTPADHGSKPTVLLYEF